MGMLAGSREGWKTAVAWIEVCTVGIVGTVGRGMLRALVPWIRVRSPEVRLAAGRHGLVAGGCGRAGCNSWENSSSRQGLVNETGT